MFVNPFGGKRRGLKIYENYARPLFDLAGVDLSVVVTKKKNEIRDALEEDDKLDGVDAVVCVGGDGTAGEVFTGLILRECRLNGVNPHNPSVAIPKPKVKVGVVPGGSTDTTSYCLHGTTDVITALLHIVMGASLGLDLISVHHEDRLLQMSSNVISYGFLGDISYYSEKLRWMGPTRYEYVGTRKMLGGNGYEGTVSILGNEIDENQSKCYQHCSRCASGNHDDNKDKWIDISSNFFLLAGANMSCAGSRNPHGLAPYCHLGDGYLNVLIVHQTSLYQRLRTFQRFSQSSYTMADLSHVETYRGKELRFKAGKVRGRWNCDGEPLLDTDIRARVHRQLIDVYSRGVAND
uniref:DAGKc domain-containing protein n=3 Tax=Photinus pyralis TaxID=7054 RepID=A0A1Y1K4P4_PHOPY